MISVAQAQARIAELVRPVSTQTIGLAEAGGRVLRAPVEATRDQPPYRSSAMDGYAVRGVDVKLGATFHVIGATAAGEVQTHRVKSGQAVRVFTGSWVPDGADFVLIQEDADRDGDTIRVREGHDTQPYIRPIGSDFSQGAKMDAPRRLTPPDVALLAAMNIPQIEVSAAPRIAVIATGDELVWPGEQPEPQQIIASNNFGLKAMLEAKGAQVQLLPIARDTVPDLTRTLDIALDADLIITMGGASVGDHDHVHRAIEAMGGALDFHKIAMRPGKPLMAGKIGETPILGLPGNPVSSMVCATLFAVPLVAALQGLGFAPHAAQKAVLSEDIGKNGPREHFMRATTTVKDGETLITAAKRQDSSLLSVLATANALLIRAPHAPAASAGETVSFIQI